MSGKCKKEKRQCSQKQLDNLAKGREKMFNNMRAQYEKQQTKQQSTKEPKQEKVKK